LWSATDRLTGYALDRGRDGSADVTAAYCYDASGQRTRSVVTSAGVVTTSTYVWEGTSLARLQSTTAGQTTTLAYLMDESGDPMAVSVSLPGTDTVYTLPVWTDAHGDVVKVCDMAGAQIALWTYDPYGRPLGAVVSGTALVPLSVAQSVAALQPLRYAGYVFDAESGLYYCSQRYFDPATAQFISRDAIGADAQESAYQYCGGDPVGKTDKTGMIGDYSGTGKVTVLDQVAHAYVHHKTKTRAQRKAKAAMLDTNPNKQGAVTKAYNSDSESASRAHIVRGPVAAAAVEKANSGLSVGGGIEVGAAALYGGSVSRGIAFDGSRFQDYSTGGGGVQLGPIKTNAGAGASATFDATFSNAPSVKDWEGTTTHCGGTVGMGFAVGLDIGWDSSGHFYFTLKLGVGFGDEAHFSGQSTALIEPTQRNISVRTPAPASASSFNPQWPGSLPSVEY
jgi:RHS repeat-associated protein